VAPLVSCAWIFFVVGIRSWTCLVLAPAAASRSEKSTVPMRTVSAPLVVRRINSTEVGCRVHRAGRYDLHFRSFLLLASVLPRPFWLGFRLDPGLGSALGGHGPIDKTVFIMVRMSARQGVVHGGFPPSAAALVIDRNAGHGGQPVMTAASRRHRLVSLALFAISLRTLARFI